MNHVVRIEVIKKVEELHCTLMIEFNIKYLATSHLILITD